MMQTYVRVGPGTIRTVDPFGPKHEDHASVGMPCPACGFALLPGDYTTAIPLGPGADPVARDRARDGRVYNAVAVEVHWACATGDETHG